MQQRQIKFRIWDGESYVTNYNYLAIGKHGSWGIWSHAETPLPAGDDYPASALEQFTGLLDKNGKEIYEGDIVENTTDIYREDEHDGRVPTGATQTSRAVVAWDAHWALFRVARDIERGRLEVIGNIHENPDLIESGATTKEE